MRPKASAPTAPLSPALKQLLLHGPETLAEWPPIEELQRLWRNHAAELQAAMPKGRKPWAAERLWMFAITTGTDIPPGC